MVALSEAEKTRYRNLLKAKGQLFPHETRLAILELIQYSYQVAVNKSLEEAGRIVTINGQESFRSLGIQDRDAQLLAMAFFAVAFLTDDIKVASGLFVWGNAEAYSQM